MNSKRIFSLSMIIFLLMSSTKVSALQLEGLKNKAGTTSKSFFYTFDLGLEKVQLFLTKDTVKKIELLTAISEERLAEAVILIEEGEESYGARSIEDFSVTLKQAQNLLGKYAVENKDNFEIQILPISEKISKFTEESFSVVNELKNSLSSDKQQEISGILENQVSKMSNLHDLIKHRFEIKNLKKELEQVEEKFTDMKNANNSQQYNKIKENYEDLKQKYIKEKQSFENMFQDIRNID
ncbi:DUF5667 domain-containing protein [Clostridium polynesiense]|uniref:DUF5667 domain-containing protein n=1 Tax=Clostridium polynesiense TaxID=1325933 RepID=UPI00058DFC69|nr:DUF5667 domain-containing protein [Clostridium polynesiense]